MLTFMLFMPSFACTGLLLMPFPSRARHRGEDTVGDAQRDPDAYYANDHAELTIEYDTVRPCDHTEFCKHMVLRHVIVTQRGVTPHHRNARAITSGALSVLKKRKSSKSNSPPKVVFARNSSVTEPLCPAGQSFLAGPVQQFSVFHQLAAVLRLTVYTLYCWQVLIAFTRLCGCRMRKKELLTRQQGTR